MSSVSETERVPPYGSDLSDQGVSEAFRGGEFSVAVYGLGKMGLPLAAVYAETCGNVTGVDIDPEVAAAVDRGESPVVEPGLDDLVGDLVAEGALSATADVAAAAAAADVHVAIVPTLITETNEPDLSIVEDLMADIAAGLSEGDLVILESTVPPRTCEDRVLPILEAGSGLELGEFGLAFCPERTSSGRALEDIRGAYPKIVGGVDDESTRVAAAIYGEISDNEIITVADATTAEAVKVFEGVYRDVNIGLANELGRHAQALDIDVTEAITAANTQPFCEIHDPGAGVGGHCIPYYPHFLIQEFDADSRLMETARSINEEMPEYTANAAIDGLFDVGIDVADARVLVLGLTYRPGVDELRATPALPIVGHLVTAGADVEAVDPVTDDTEAFERAGATIRDLEALGDESYDAVVLVTPQKEFESLDVPSLGRGDAPLVVVDGRQELTELRGDSAVHYRGVGVNV